MIASLVRKRRANAKLARSVFETLEGRCLMSAGVIYSSTGPDAHQYYGGSATDDGIGTQIMQDSQDPVTGVISDSHWSVHLNNMVDHNQFTTMTFTVNVTSQDPNSNDFLVLQERDPVTHAVTNISSVAVPQGGGEATISDPAQPNAALNDEFSLQLETGSAGSDYFTVESGQITAEMSTTVSGSDGAWGAYTGSSGTISFTRNGSANQAKDIYYTIQGTTVQTDIANDGPGAVSGPQLDPATGVYKVTIPAGQAGVSVSLTPTDNPWVDGNGVEFGDAPTPVTVTIVPAPTGAPLTYLPPTIDDPNWGPGSTTVMMYNGGETWSRVFSTGKKQQINKANGPILLKSGTKWDFIVAVPGAGNDPFVAKTSVPAGGVASPDPGNFKNGVAEVSLDLTNAKPGDYTLDVNDTQTGNWYSLSYTVN
jgi:hypothetical protein